MSKYETEARAFVEKHNLAFNVDLLGELAELLENYDQEGYDNGYDEGREAGLEEARDRLA